ncbi:MAG TPA: hypothetical protein VNQ77_05615 [Frankiaceae bacterium]|nr:hypothetical protein [Frankiaceae bacterium]
MTKRMITLALAAGAAAAFALPTTASAIPRCTDRPVEDCVKEIVGPISTTCIPSGDLERPC